MISRQNLIALLTGGIFAFSPVSSSLAGPGEEIPLWEEGKVPGEAGVELPPEKAEDKNNDGIIRISNVSVPTMQFFPDPKENNTGAVVVVAPGGGYSILASKHEGSDVCKWLNTIGVNAVLLKYRVPRRKDREKHAAPLEDAQRAIQLVRTKTDEWKIDPERVGILGFSAGGHLATMALTTETVTISQKEALPSARPDFGVLVYPAYMLDEKTKSGLSPEIQVDESTPPVFIVIAHGDKRFVEGCARFYIEMHRNKRDCELHIYGKGGHGFGMKPIEERVSGWPQQAGQWMEEMGFLKNE
ncbi:MAG: alpha/beta hydrolase [Verrucomicrobiales bacterium]|nr:alpha/beta hydrolase [Verrucomicrobiales bacterium]